MLEVCCKNKVIYLKSADRQRLHTGANQWVVFDNTLCVGRPPHGAGINRLIRSVETSESSAVAESLWAEDRDREARSVKMSQLVAHVLVCELTRGLIDCAKLQAAVIVSMLCCVKVITPGGGPNEGSSHSLTALHSKTFLSTVDFCEAAFTLTEYARPEAEIYIFLAFTLMTQHSSDRAHTISAC